MDIKEKLLQCFLNIGIVIEDTEDDIDLKEYIEESIEFVTAIVEIERVFSIEFPDELLLFSIFDSLNGLTKIVESLIKESNES